LDIWTINNVDIISVRHQLPAGVTGEKAFCKIQNLVPGQME